jgi:hypothetical protein
LANLEVIQLLCGTVMAGPRMTRRLARLTVSTRLYNYVKPARGFLRVIA